MAETGETTRTIGEVLKDIAIIHWELDEERHTVPLGRIDGSTATWLVII